jgi:hypothetical protein
VLSDIGTEADAPVAFFKSRLFETKMKSSGLAAKGRFLSAPPAPPTHFFLIQYRDQDRKSEERTAPENRERGRRLGGFQKAAFSLSSNIKLRRAKKI